MNAKSGTKFGRGKDYWTAAGLVRSGWLQVAGASRQLELDLKFGPHETELSLLTSFEQVQRARIPSLYGDGLLRSSPFSKGCPEHSGTVAVRGGHPARAGAL